MMNPEKSSWGFSTDAMRITDIAIIVAIPTACFAAGWTGTGIFTAPEPRNVEVRTIEIDDPPTPTEATRIAQQMDTLSAIDPEGWRPLIYRLDAAQLRAYLKEQGRTEPLERVKAEEGRLGRLEGQATRLRACLKDQNSTDTAERLKAMAQRLGEVEGEALQLRVYLEEQNSAEPVERLKAVAQRLVELEGESALEFVLGLPLGRHGDRSLLPPAVRAWAEAKPAEALRWTWQNSKRDTLTVANLVRHLAGRDPVRTAELFHLIAPDREATRELVWQWNSVDPKAALAWAATLVEKSDAQRIRGVAFDAWIETDPMSAAQHVASLEPAAAQELLGESNDVPAVLEHMEAGAARQLVATLEKAKPGLTEFFTLQELAVSDPEAAAAALRRIDGDRTHPRTGFVYKLIERIANRDPESAIEFALKLEFTSIRQAVLHWADRDPTSALSYLLQMDPGRIRDNALGDYLDWMARYDVAGAAQILASYLGREGVGNPFFKHGYVAGGIARGLFLQNPQSAGEWAVALEQPDARRMALRGVFKHWIYHDPTTARSGMEALGLNGEEIDALDPRKK